MNNFNYNVSPGLSETWGSRETRWGAVSRTERKYPTKTTMRRRPAGPGDLTSGRPRGCSVELGEKPWADRGTSGTAHNTEN